MARLLGAVTNVGELNRMIQFKEKAIRGGQEASLALMDYPVLMAADILLYQAQVVPVGDDQRQHLELTRELAERFNRRFGKGVAVLTVPQPLTLKDTARVMSLTDGTKKMSKSDVNEASRINLSDTAEQIRNKIKRAKTDSLTGLEFGNPDRPEVDNLLTLYQVFSFKSREEVQSECAEMRFGEFKNRLAEAVIASLAPIQARYSEFLADRSYLASVLREGREKAQARAQQTLDKALSAMGFLSA